MKEIIASTLTDISPEYSSAALAGKAPRLTRRVFEKNFNYAQYKSFRALFSDKLTYYRTLLCRLKTQVLLVGEDGVSSELWMIQAATRLGIPVLIIPYEASGREDFFNLLRQKQLDGSFISLSEPQIRLLKNAGESRWMTNFEGEVTTIYPPEFIIALHDVGIRINDPWTTHGGIANVLAAESAGMVNHYLSEGLDQGKVRLTGSPYADQIAMHLSERSDLMQAYESCHRINGSETSILVSLPPDYDHERGHLSPFQSYTGMCQAVARHLSRIPDARVTFVVHPAYRSQADLLAEVKEISISTEWILDLIAQHDVFITAGSSTVRWAAACRKPSIDMDFYKFRLAIFRQLPGFRSFEDPDAFYGHILELTRDGDEAAQIRSELKDRSAQWGEFDGASCERIGALISELAR